MQVLEKLRFMKGKIYTSTSWDFDWGFDSPHCTQSIERKL